MREVYGAHLPQDDIHIHLIKNIEEANIEYQQTNGELIISTNFKREEVVYLENGHLLQLKC